VTSLLKIIASTVIVTILLGTGAAATIVYSGAFNVAATDPHSSAVTWLLETARVRSIQAHAAGIAVPPGFDEQAKVQGAVGHFAAHCVVCHGAPGVDRNEFADGMYPRPPDLTDVSERYTPAQLFWILKNGIKMTGMPSMADDSDDLLWATVGLLQKLPGMTPDAFKTLAVAAQATGGGHHHHHDHMHDHTLEMHLDDGGAGQANGQDSQVGTPAVQPQDTHDH
jgi:mono/diheme cytochrome c family protein